MHIGLVLLIVLAFVVLSGGFFGGQTPGTGYYGRGYGVGFSGLLLILAAIWFFGGLSI